MNSPPVKFAPGTWVRISGWIKVLGTNRPGTRAPTPRWTAFRASADGAMFFDTTAGEAYAIRLTQPSIWKEYHVYRRVPANGEVRVRMALTGFGTVYFDNIRIEPYLGSESKRIGEVSVPPAK